VLQLRSQHTDRFCRSCRELERERKGLEANEKKIIAEMKKDAKEGQSRAAATHRRRPAFSRARAGKMPLVRIRAKSLITTRNSIQKFYTMGCQLQGLGLRLTAMASTQAMTDAMKVASPHYSLPPPIILHLFISICPLIASFI
jgi:charged multivesicular body protein 2A